MRKLYYILLIFVFSQTLQATRYYFSSSGDNNNNGLYEETPWKHLDKLRHVTIIAGDTISFKRGEIIYGEISRTGAGFIGTEALPIVFNTYGEGAKPILMGDCSEGTWIQDTRRDSLWKKWIGWSQATSGWECINGTWVLLNNMNDLTGRWNTKWYLSNPDTLEHFLDMFTQSTYDACTHTDWDTLYIQTHDGLSPQDSVIIFRNNTISGNYLIIRDLEFNSWNTAIAPFPMNNSIIRNCEFRDARFATIILHQSSDNLIDSCTVHNGGYTPLYSRYCHRNIFRVDTVRNIDFTIRGTYGGAEHGGFGFERDTGSVIEYCYVTGCHSGAFDAFYNYQDTIRYSTFNNGQLGGLFINGDSWVVHDNIINANSGILVSIGRYHDLPVGQLGQSHVYNNTIVVDRTSYNTAGTGIAFQSNGGDLTFGNGSKGTLLFENNTITGQYSASNLDKFSVTEGLTSINNHFFSPGRLSVGAFPNELFYTSLSAFQLATGLESGSTWNEVPSETPIITISENTFIFGNIPIDDVSDESTVILNGVYLTPASGDIIVTAPTGFEVSTTSGSGFGSSLNVSYTDSTLSSTTIYVRFAPLLAQSYSDTVTFSGGGAITKKIAVTGTGIVMTTIIKTSGDNQSGYGNTTINPFVVTLTSGGTPVEGIYVTWYILSMPDGSTGELLSSYSSNTDADGESTTTMTLGSMAGTYIVKATAPELIGDVDFTVTVLSPPITGRGYTLFGK